MAGKTKKARLEDVHREAMDRFETLQTNEQSQRELAIEDMLFVNSETGQWDEEALASRADRPRYTINRIAPVVAQIVGDQRQNRTAIKVRPSDGDASKGVAKIYDGIIRNIEAQSQAENSYDAAFDEAVTGGYGGWAVTTEFNDNDSFDQDIRIKPIVSAASSLWFGPAEKYDKRDAMFAFHTVFMSDDEFSTRWPNAILTDFDERQYSRNVWFRDNMIRVAHYWRKIQITKRIGLMRGPSFLGSSRSGIRRLR